MNELIKQLARQCYKTGPLGKYGWPEYTTFDEEKFAELIIKDCIAEVLLYDCSSVNSNKETYLDGFIDGTERGYKDAVEQIAEGLALRYGVE
jgi:hypothetical protein